LGAKAMGSVSRGARAVKATDSSYRSYHHQNHTSTLHLSLQRLHDRSPCCIMLLCTSLADDTSAFVAYRRYRKNPCARPKERGRSVTVQAGIFTQSPFRTIDHDISTHDHLINTKSISIYS
jgi:hypothetical protein